MFTCGICQKNFASNQNLIKHQTLRKTPCKKETIFKCDICLTEFANKYNLTRHTKRKTPCKRVVKVEINDVKDLSPSQIINNNNINSNNTINNYNIIIQNEAVAKRIFEHINKSTCQITANKNKGNEYILQLSNRSSDSVFDQSSAIFDLIERMFFNIDKPENWILLKDEVENRFKIKLDESSFKDFNTNIFHVVYLLFKDISKHANKNKNDPMVLKFYKNYINKYENNHFTDVNSKKMKASMHKFITYINNRMNARYENFIETIENLLLRETGEVDLSWMDTYIEMTPFGNEDLLNFNREELIKSIDFTDKYQFLLSIVKFIHINDDFPKYQTIEYEEEKIIIWMNRPGTQYPYWNTQIDEYYFLDTLIKNIKSIRSYYQIEEIAYKYLNYDESDIPIYINLISDYFKSKV